jgi:hypothetical protein
MAQMTYDDESVTVASSNSLLNDITIVELLWRLTLLFLCICRILFPLFVSTPYNVPIVSFPLCGGAFYPHSAHWSKLQMKCQFVNYSMLTKVRNTVKHR